MNRRHMLTGFGAAVLVGGGGAAWMLTREATPFELISESEAQQHQSRTLNRKIFTTKSDGPQIVFHSPQQIAMSSPVNFDVEFKARNGAAPVMDSLKIDYNLGLVWFDITGRLLAHATTSGSRLRSKNAVIPPGHHEIRMRIEDTQQRMSEVLLKLNVS